MSDKRANNVPAVTKGMERLARLFLGVVIGSFLAGCDFSWMPQCQTYCWAGGGDETLTTGAKN